MKNTIKEMVLVSISIILIAISSWIEIPLIIPITLQNLVIFVIIGLFGFKISQKSIVFYILIGLIGIPVFANFSSGITPFINYTGGYLISFIFYPVIYLFVDKIINNENYLKYLLSFIISLILSYIIGTIWFYTVFSQNEKVSILYCITISVLPFVIPDIIKMVLSIFVIYRIKKMKE